MALEVLSPDCVPPEAGHHGTGNVQGRSAPALPHTDRWRDCYSLKCRGRSVQPFLRCLPEPRVQSARRESEYCDWAGWVLVTWDVGLVHRPQVDLTLTPAGSSSSPSAPHGPCRGDGLPVPPTFKCRSSTSRDFRTGLCLETGP